MTQRRSLLWRALARTLLGLILLLLFDPGTPWHTVRAQDTTITFVCCSYTPSTVTITLGDTVTWQGDFTSHPLVSDDALWPTHSTGTTFSFTFTQAGDYRFHCAIHGGPGGIGMSGQVHVRGPQQHLFLPIVVR